MAHSGPHLPSSHNEKRKRDNDLIITGDASDSSSAYGERSRTPDASAKRPRTIGPSLPPANSEERPSAGPENPSESGSDGDEFGPSLPPVGASAAQDSQQHQPKSAPSMGPQIPSKSQRDEWMIVPPSSDDWTARVDPTKLKSRKFNTGKGAKGPSGALSRGEDSKWTETPGERKARLEREVMGIADNASPRGAPRDDVKAAATAQKLREYNEKSRGSTLYNEHQKTNPREKEDDPSARAFDREKDIAGGTKINSTQRREMMRKAADFSSRFSSARYL